MSEFTLENLEQIIATRANITNGSSYTASLVTKGSTYATKKLGEEAFETVIAALSEDRNRLISESADLIYHLLVVWKIRSVRLADILTELEKRTARSGLQEKATRIHD
ncbi:MAG: phosphoribosyl-ATP pyrophosphohydrolase [Candidatus Tokpelaia sp. JSC189]|nr:MAG: phosphoribosyl-ATP pyrophosphohydrolase [Candidatus Tokpelaia sp. JSC189]